MLLPRILIFLLVLMAATIPAQHLLIEHQTERVLRRAISDSTQAANTTATRLFVNEVYARIAEKLGLENSAEPRQPLAGRALEDIDSNIQQFILGTDILKVKIFNKSGVTVYSTNFSQIGQDQSGNPAVIAASQGVAASQITHRGKRDAIHPEELDRNMVSSYIPLRNPAGAIVGVVEMYTDRTPIIERTLGGEGHLHPYLLLANAVQLMLLAFIAWACRSYLINAKEDIV